MPPKTKWKAGPTRVSIDACVPNDWNMNEMDPQVYEKTKLVIRETLEQEERIPCIVVRPHPKLKDKLQIIDGYHRWKMLQELDYAEIDVDIMVGLTDERAMMMTAELNYNRGNADPDKYASYLARLQREFDRDTEYLAQRFSDSKDEIDALLAETDLVIEPVTISKDDEDASTLKDAKDASEADALLEVKFTIRQGAAEVVEHELSRIGKLLGGGKNLRGRALEMMAVLSSQTPTASITAALTSETDETSDEVVEVTAPPPIPGKKKVKEELRSKAKRAHA